MTMLTSQKVKETAGWTEVFPLKLNTEQKSLMYVKKLVAVAISNITYLRNVFPGRAYGDRMLSDLTIKILKKDPTCPGSGQVIDWLQGVFDALEKKYLKTLVLGIYTNPNDPEMLLEAYTFRFCYTENSTGMEMFSNGTRVSEMSDIETREDTMKLLRSLVVLLQNLKRLPQDFMMTMKLLYYDDVTPAEYEPPGFHPALTDRLPFDEETMKIKIGDIATPFHSMKVRIITASSQFQDNPDGRERSVIISDGLDSEAGRKLIIQPGLDNDEDMSQHSGPGVTAVSHTDKGLMSQEPAQADSAPHITPGHPVSACPSQQVMSSDTSQDADMPQGHGVRCACAFDGDDGLMILCAVCDYWQHSICFRIIQGSDVPHSHICHLCAMPSDESRKPTDNTLLGLSTDTLKMTCLWRRALFSCTETTRVSVVSMSDKLGVDTATGAELMKRLEKEGYVIPGKQKTAKAARDIDCNKVKTVGIQKYFYGGVLTDDDKINKLATRTSRMDLTTSAQTTMNNIPAGRVAVTVSQVPATNNGYVPVMRRDGLRVQSPPNSVTQNKPVGRPPGKRVRAAESDSTTQFEVSNSQTVEQTSEPGRKRAKTSIARQGVKKL